MASTAVGKSVIHYIGSDGGSWGSFLQKKLSEAQYGIPTELHEIGAPWLETTKYDVNIALVSPDFLTLDSFEKFQRCSTVHSLAILLGTTTTEFHEAVWKENAQSRLLKWICYCPQQTRDSVKGLLLTIINLYENLHGGDEVDDEESCAEDPLFKLVPDTYRSSGECENIVDYDTLPPARQINALHDIMQLPCNEDEEYHELLILLDRRADSDLVLTLDSGENIQTEEINKAVYKARIHKNLIRDTSIKFVAVCKEQIFGSMECKFDSISQNEEGKNKESVHQTQRSDSVLTNHRYQDDSKSSNPDLPSSLDIIHAILERETDPVQLLCRALRIPYADHEQLDKHLSGRCRRLRITGHFTELMLEEEADKDSDSEWPTLLHFCADTNLLQSTNELLQIPCLVSACLKCNRNQETPKDIAKRNGFTDMVKLLEKHRTERTEVARLRSSDSGILDSNEDSCFPIDIGTSMRDKHGGHDSRNVDSGVSELHHYPYHGRESDYRSPTRMSKAVKSASGVALSSSVSDLRPSGNYDSIAARGLISKSYQEPKASNPFPEGQKEGDSTWFVDHPPSYQFARRRSSESDKDNIRLSNRDSRKTSGSFGQKKQSFSKALSNVFKIKRNKSMSSNPESTIPEESHSDQTTPEERGRGFPCSAIVSYDDLQEEEVLVSPKTPMKERRAPQKDTKIKERTEEAPEPPKRAFKKMKNPFKKKVDRRKSLRMSRVLKDNNVVVLALPTKNDLHV